MKDLNSMAGRIPTWMTIFIAFALCVVFGLGLAAWYVNSLFKGPNYSELPTHYPFKTKTAEQQYQEYYDERAKEWPTPSETRYVETSFGKTFVRICGVNSTSKCTT